MTSASPTHTPVLRSPALLGPYRHAFSTRVGGSSPAPWDSLNLGSVRSGDSAQHLDENWRRFVGTVDAKVVHRVRQVHGVRVLAIEADDDPLLTADQEADALMTDAPGVAVAVRVADCVPLLIADPVSGAVAAVHAGWRGTAAGIAAATVRAMVSRYGSRPEDLQAAIGPSIGPCCFEVGPEVVAGVCASLPADADVVRETESRPHVDLWAANRAQLYAAGVQIADVLGACTRCDPERFFSYRRVGAGTGQQAAVIVPAPLA